MTSFSDFDSRVIINLQRSLEANGADFRTINPKLEALEPDGICSTSCNMGTTGIMRGFLVRRWGTESEDVEGLMLQCLMIEIEIS